MKACKYHPQRKVNPYRKGVDYNYMKTSVLSFKPDNFFTKYDEKDTIEPLENKIKKAIKKEFESWNNPCYLEVINPQEPSYKQP